LIANAIEFLGCYIQSYDYKNLMIKILILTTLNKTIYFYVADFTLYYHFFFL